MVSGCCFFSVYQGKGAERTKAGLSLNCKVLYSEKSQAYICQPLNSFLGITSTHYTREPVQWGLGGELDFWQETFVFKVTYDSLT